MSIEELWNGPKAAAVRDKFKAASDGLAKLDVLTCEFCGVELQDKTCVKCPACGQTSCEE